MMALNKQKIQPLLDDSGETIDVSQFAYNLGFSEYHKIYVTKLVWEKYILWTVDDNHRLNMQLTQHERQYYILRDAFLRFSVSGQEFPEKEMFFYRKVLPRDGCSSELDLVLFRLSLKNDLEQDCFHIDAINLRSNICHI